MRPAALAAILLAMPLLAGPTLAADDLQALLDEVAPGLDLEEAVVDVDATMVGDQLVVRIAPRGATKLVADPGVVVTPATGAPVAVAVPGQDYFTGPAEVRVQVQPGGPVTAHVEYAYCVVAKQCLFGEAVLRVDETGVSATCTAAGTTIAC